MKKETKNIASRVSAMVSPKIEELGYSLWDVEYLREGADWFLRITIDSENGIDIDDCEKVHRAVEVIIDEADPIEDAYYLEISSPGLERELKNDAHLAACLGMTVEARLYAPINGAKSFVGALTAYDGESYTLTLDSGEEEKLPRPSVAKIQTVYDFE